MEGENKRPYIGPLRHQVIPLVISIAILALAGMLYYLYETYTVTEVSVTGNRHYTVEQISDIVMTGKLGHNSIYLYFKYKNRQVDDVPFVEMMDVNIVSPTAISVTVYEKAIAGCVSYLDRYMYFDKDGIVVETFSTRQKDIPCVTGLSFDHVVLYEKLPVENDAVFENILSITQLLSKYKITTDQIYFDVDDNITLYFDQARVRLGSFENIDEKMIRLQSIIPELEGLKGVLYLDDYTENSSENYITFQRDDVQRHEEIADEVEEETEGAGNAEASGVDAGADTEVSDIQEKGVE